MDGIPLVERRWVRDSEGFAHAIRESEGEHHTCYCRKYIKGTPCQWSINGPVRPRCEECQNRLKARAPAEIGTDIPVCVMRGAGLGTGIRIW